MRLIFSLLVTVALSKLTSCADSAGVYLGESTGYEGRVRSMVELTNSIPVASGDDFIIANSGIHNDSLNLVIEHAGSGYYDVHLFMVRGVQNPAEYHAYLTISCVEDDDSQADLLSYMSFSLESMKSEPIDSAIIILAGTNDVQYVYKP